MNRRHPLLQWSDHYAKFRVVKSILVHGDLRSVPNPQITIAIPTFDRPGVLKDAIDSALAQDGSIMAHDVIVVDNSPEPYSATARLIETYDDPRLLYYRNSENIGLFGNLNRCFELARGEWVALLHDDDLLNEDYLSAVSPLLSRMHSAAAIMANFDRLDERGAERPAASGTPRGGAASNLVTRVRPSEAIMHDRNVYGAPTCGSLFRREVVLAEGGFDDDCPSADWFFVFRLSAHHPVYRTVTSVGQYRLAHNMSLKPETLRGLVADALRFRRLNRAHTALGGLVDRVFGPEQYVRSLQMVRNLEGSDDFDWHRYDDIAPYQLRPGRLRAYNRALALHGRLTNLETHLRG